MHDDVLAFWFEQTEPAQWWASDPALDALIRRRYATLLQQAASGELYAWRASRGSNPARSFRTTWTRPRCWPCCWPSRC